MNIIRKMARYIHMYHILLNWSNGSSCNIATIKKKGLYLLKRSTLDFIRHTCFTFNLSIKINKLLKILVYISGILQLISLVKCSTWISLILLLCSDSIVICFVIVILNQDYY